MASEAQLLNIKLQKGNQYFWGKKFLKENRKIKEISMGSEAQLLNIK